MTVIRTIYDPPERRYTHPVGVSKTRQEFLSSCDINSTMKRFSVTGYLPVNAGSPRFVDNTTVTDYQEAQMLLMNAQESFDALPALLRKRFGNDPEKLVLFLSDEKNLDEAIKLGLVQPPVLPETIDVDQPNLKVVSPAETA